MTNAAANAVPDAAPDGSGLTPEERADDRLRDAQRRHLEQRAAKMREPVAPDVLAARIRARRELEEEARRAEEAAREEEAVSAAVVAPCIVPKHRDSTLTNYRPITPSQRAMVEYVRAWLRAAHDGDGVQLALIGPKGTGKSHMLYAAAKLLHAAGRKVYVQPWYLLADALRYGGRHPFNGAWIEAHEIRRVLLEQRIVLIDDVQPTASTGFDDTELTKIAKRCYDERVPLLITTNENPLTTLVSAPAASRFTKFIVTGPDYRELPESER